MKMAERARFVVASVTPKSIGTEGFLLELEMLSNVLSHKWIILVMGSWRRKVLVNNWLGFLETTRHLPLFAPLGQVAGAHATQAMGHLPDIGALGPARPRLGDELKRVTGRKTAEILLVVIDLPYPAVRRYLRGHLILV